MADFFDDTNKPVTLADVFRGLIGKDVNGNFGLRVVEAADDDENLVDCESKNMSEEELVRSIIAVDSNGRAALRLVTSTE